MFYKMVGSASSRHWNSAVSLLSGQNMGWTAASLDDIFDKFSFSQSWPMLVSLWPILIMILDADQSGFDLKAVAIITIIILQIILFIMIWVTWPGRVLLRPDGCQNGFQGRPTQLCTRWDEKNCKVILVILTPIIIDVITILLHHCTQNRHNDV